MKYKQAFSNTSISYTEKVAESEKEHGYKNATLIDLLKSYAILKAIVIWF